MTTLSQIYEQVCDLRAAVAKEGMQRLEIELSEPYQEYEKEIAMLTEHIANLRNDQQALTASVPNSQGALEEAEKALFELMKTTGQESYGQAKMKYSNSRSVNKSLLLVELDGDLDVYLKLSSVTQKALTDYCKEAGDNRLLSCVETVSTPVGLSFES